jgi:hypothetical protein
LPAGYVLGLLDRWANTNPFLELNTYLQSPPSFYKDKPEGIFIFFYKTSEEIIKAKNTVDKMLNEQAEQERARQIADLEAQRSSLQSRVNEMTSRLATLSDKEKADAEKTLKDTYVIIDQINQLLVSLKVVAN